MTFRGHLKRSATLLSAAVLAAGVGILPACETDNSGRRASTHSTYDVPRHNTQASSNTRTAQPRTETRQAPAAETTRRSAPRATNVSTSGNMSRSSIALPTGDPRTSALTLEKMMPREVVAGQPFDYIINVTNVSDVALNNVIVSDTLPSGMRIASSEPDFMSRAGDASQWNLGTIPPGESRAIRLRASAAGAGTLSSCATVTYDSSLCSTIEVVQPELQLVKRVPSEALLCEMIPVTFTVTNSGSGSARNVVINDPLPQGWATEAGQREIRINVGTLAAGQSESYTVNVKSSSTGSFENTATATAANDLSAESGTTTTVVSQPELQIIKRGPERRYAGRNITYQVAVRNVGDATARNVVIEDRLPSNARFVSASNNGRQSGGNVVWNLSELRPGASASFDVTVASSALGTVRNTVVARAECAAEVSANAQTRVEGIPGLLLECVDVEDPIEVGNNITYVITVTNQGSAPGTGIKITADLPDSTTYVSSEGATRGNVRGDTITFATLPSLAPGQRATWRIIATAREAEVAQISVVMEANELQGKTMSETEATNLYE